MQVVPAEQPGVTDQVRLMPQSQRAASGILKHLIAKTAVESADDHKATTLERMTRPGEVRPPNHRSIANLCGIRKVEIIDKGWQWALLP